MINLFLMYIKISKYALWSCSLIASQKANYHQSQAKNKTSFTDSSVFILEL